MSERPKCLRQVTWVRRAGIACALVWAFVVGFPWRQSLEVTLHRGEFPEGATPVKIIDRNRRGGCNRDGIQGQTDAHGRFTATRWKSWALIDMVTVIVQSDTVCVNDGDGWRPIWSVPYGPALPKVHWDCDLQSTPTRNQNGVIGGICDLRKATHPTR